MKLTKIQRMLLGTAIGDAFGRGYEGKNREHILLEFDDSGYRDNTAKYTDDTQMTLAVAELILSNLPFCEETLASNFVFCYRRDERNGYSNVTKEALEKAYCGKDFLKDNSFEKTRHKKSNGSVMRALPIGLFKDEIEVITYARLSSKITHAHPEAIDSTIAIALMSHGLYYEVVKPKRIIKYIIKNLDHNSILIPYLEEIDQLTKYDFKVLLKEDHNKGLPCDALKTMGVVLYLVKNLYNEPFEALKQAILIGGDVDSSASIALGAILINNTLDSIPSYLEEELENKKYGKSYILKLGQELSKKYKVKEL